MRCKHIDVLKVKVLKDYTLRLQFEDGTQGKVDISKIVPFKDIFEPLKDKSFFSKVSVNIDIGTICWKNGADVSPTYLYSQISKK
jgi:hypothetical protein